ncbi:hypothetical protein ABZY36_28035 [Streptomyces sp. NPDC006627]|uniref:hypothetical protein n=1 Tax=Streptomyces sp. NPDC006627 TaxID=3154679 RepID=UPI0033B8F4BD
MSAADIALVRASLPVVEPHVAELVVYFYAVLFAHYPQVRDMFPAELDVRRDTFHVRAVPGGTVSNALVHRARPGDSLRLGPPEGDMVLRPTAGRDLLFVAGGTGLAPIRALIE